uniref:Peptidase S8 pro-domain domain-containing protein n=1 Tax=Plectus sambesii TaxID=2011161 RepID=A0A914WEP2_9BILA
MASDGMDASLPSCPVRCVRIPSHRKTRRRHNSGSSSGRSLTLSHPRSSLIYSLMVSSLMLMIAMCLLSSVGAVQKAYTNQWALEIAGGDEKAANEMAAKYGFKNLGRIIPGENFFLFESFAVRPRTRRRTRSAQTASISREYSVQWLQQQVAKRRVKRGYNAMRRRQTETDFPEHIGDSNSVLDTKWLVRPPMVKNKSDQPPVVNLSGPYNPNDPLWSDMWYL